ncbi:hypothetical protein NO2_0846 [Candidatus Termititenax persephonae]|uniref:Fibronectin type-III domain-containing protein n=1 Tax=Candidatus Termititenax persephonae TaxID=2218525 RepID=A0A388TIQ4_9BACT|nr:hypothetical protein NO2_0846 [Candidatus Termititenax persephonae]
MRPIGCWSRSNPTLKLFNRGGGGGGVTAQGSPSGLPESVKNILQSQGQAVTKKVFASENKQGGVAAMSVPEDNPLDRWYAIEYPNDISVLELIKILQDDPNIEHAQPSFIYKPASISFPNPTIPNDTNYGKQWHLPAINAPQGWNINTGSAATVIAIIDTGVSFNSEDLSPDRKTSGYNFVDDNDNTNPDYSYSDPDYPYYNGNHGTIVAELAAAKGDNHTGGAGVDWRAKIMPLKVFGDGPNSPNSGQSDTLSQAIMYAANNGAKIINLSLSSELTLDELRYFLPGRPITEILDYLETITFLERDACYYAYNKGAVLVAPMGNHGDDRISYPAAFNCVIAVGSIASNNVISSLSTRGSYGKTVELVAPGENIPSWWDGEISYNNGASYAAPLVSGLAALIKSVSPNMTNARIREVLRQSANDLGAAGQDDIYGYGKINVYRALYLAENSYLPPESPTNPEANVWQNTISPTINWWPASDNGGPAITTYNICWQFWGSPNMVSEDWDEASENVTASISKSVSINQWVVNDKMFGSGQYFLFVQAVNDGEKTGAWKKVYSLLYDNVLPTMNIINIAEIHEEISTNRRYFYSWENMASDGDSGVAGYYYCWGQDASATSDAYTTDCSFTIEIPEDSVGTYYLRVSPRDGAGNKGDWVTVSIYTLNKSPIFTQLPSLTEYNVSKNTPPVTGSWTDAKARHDGADISTYNVRWGKYGGYVLYTYDKTTTSSVINSTYFQEGDGIYWLWVQAVDTSDNATDWYPVLKCIYDTTAPVFSLVPSSKELAVSENTFPFTVSWNAATDNMSAVIYDVYWTKEDDATVSVNYSQTTTTSRKISTANLEYFGTGNGVYYLKVKAVDAAGNHTGWYSVLTCNYDTVIPLFSPSLTELDVSKNTRSFTISWTDASPMADYATISTYNVRWGKYGGAISITYNTTTTVSDVIDVTSKDYFPDYGIYWLEVQAVDNLGNATAWFPVLICTYNATVPVFPKFDLTILDVSQNASSVRGNWPDAEAMDGESIATYNVRWGKYGGTILVTYDQTETSREIDPIYFQEEGVYWLEVRAFDTANNTTAWQKVVQYTYDKTAPNFNPIMAEKITSSDAYAAVSWLDVTDALSDVTTYNVRWYKNDKTIFVTYNNQLPTLSIEINSAYFTQGGGVYWLKVQAVDALGNATDWLPVLKYIYQKFEPELTVRVASQNTSAITVNWTDISVPTYNVRWTKENDDTVLVTYSQTTTVSREISTANQEYLGTGDGVYYLDVQAVDASGNATDWHQVLKYTYDTKPPSFNPILYTMDDSPDISPITVSWLDATDMSAVTYDVRWETSGGELLVTYNRDATVTVSEEIDITDSDYFVTWNNVYWLKVRAVDASGNTTNWQTVLKYTYDTTPPTFNQAWKLTEKVTSLNIHDAVTWNEATDARSGVAMYNVRWTKENDKDFSPITYSQPATVTISRGISPTYFTRGDGVYYLDVQAVDAMGNATAWHPVSKYTYNTAVPVFNPTLQEHVATRDASAITVNWTDISVPTYNVRWRKDGGGVLLTDSQATTVSEEIGSTNQRYSTGRVDGVYWLEVQAVNAIGNATAWRPVLKYTYDATAPTFNPALREKITSSNAHAAVSWLAATDMSGVAMYNVQWRKDGGTPSEPFLVTYNQTAAVSREINSTYFQGDGVYWLEVRAVDKLGNATEDWRPVLKYTYDTTSPNFNVQPTTSPIEPIETPTENHDAESWASATDVYGVSHYDVQWGVKEEDGQAWVWKTTYTVVSPSSGLLPYNAACSNNIYWLDVRAVDKAGNATGWKNIITCNYQLGQISSPSMTTTGVVEGWTDVINRARFTWSPAVDYSGQGIDGYYVYWGPKENGESMSFSLTNSYDPPTCNNGKDTNEGIYYLRVQALDGAGEKSLWTTVLTYRYTPYPPTSQIVDWTSKNILERFPESITINVQSSKNYIYWGNDANGESYTISTNADTYRPENCVTSDVYYLRVCPEDSEGRLGRWTTMLTYYYDEDAPIFNMSIKQEGWTNVKNRAEYHWTPAVDTGGSLIQGYNVYWGTTTNTNAKDLIMDTYQTSNTFSQPLSCDKDGTYYLCVQAIDNAGNTSNWQTLLEYKYDATAPKVEKEVEELDWSKESVVVSRKWDASDGVGSGVVAYNIYWGKNEYGVSPYTTTTVTASGALACDYGNGTYYLRVQAVDLVGNKSDFTTIMIYKYGTAPPQGGITVNDGAMYVTSDKVNLALDYHNGNAVNDNDNDNAAIQMNIQGVTHTYLNDNTWVKAERVLEDATLVGGEGIKSISVQYRDVLGSLSDTYPATIIYDATPPVFSSPTNIKITTANKNLDLITWNAATDAVSGVSTYNIYWGFKKNTVDSTDTTTATEYGPLECEVENTTYYLCVRPVDKAGNVGDWQTVLTYIYSESLPPSYDDGGGADNNEAAEESDYVQGNGGTGEKAWSFPNPFSPATDGSARIAYVVPKSGWTKIYIYNQRGIKVWQSEYYAEAERDNIVPWDGHDLRGRVVANGTYILLVADEKKKIIGKGRLLLLD